MIQNEDLPFTNPGKTLTFLNWDNSWILKLTGSIQVYLCIIQKANSLAESFAVLGCHGNSFHCLPINMGSVSTFPVMFGIQVMTITMHLSVALSQCTGAHRRKGWHSHVHSLLGQSWWPLELCRCSTRKPLSSSSDSGHYWSPMLTKTHSLTHHPF